MSPTTQAIARQAGVDDFIAEATPEKKLAYLRSEQAEGKLVAMMGDGTNDAPSLAAAHVSLSPVCAAHIAQAHADAVFLGEQLAPMLDAVRIGRRARRLMQQNLWLAVVYNAIAVPIAIAGFATPLIAAVAMSGSSILVTVNALRVRRRGEDRAPEPAASPQTFVPGVPSP